MIDTMTKWFLHHQQLAGYLEPIMQRFKPAWRAGFYRAEVACIEPINEKYLELWLAPESTWPIHKAGQHLELTVEMNGQLRTRVFTIASSPEQYRASGLVRLLIRTHELGRFTPHLTTYLASESWCNISAPQGTFLFPQRKMGATLMVAGGSGITPFLAMLSQHLGETCHPVKLIYIARAGEHLAEKELNTLAARYAHFSYFPIGRTDFEPLTHYLNDLDAPIVYCCGPQALMEQVATQSRAANLSYFDEPFGLATQINLAERTEHAVKVAHHQYAVDNQRSLLDQLEQQRVSVRRGCGMGICHQCQCVKKQGLVRDMRTGELSDTGESLIQLCVVQAVTDVEIAL